MPDNIFGYKILIDGSAISIEDALRVDSIKISHRLDSVANAELVVRVWDRMSCDIDEEAIGRYAVGKPITINGGYGDGAKFTSLFSGEIDGVSLHFAIPVTLTVSCRCLGNRLRRAVEAESTGSEDNTPDAVHLKTVAEAMVSKVGLTAEDFSALDASYPHLLRADGQSDWDYLLLKAQSRGCFMYVTDKIMRIKPPSNTFDSSSGKTYTWGKDILSLDMRFDASKAALNVLVTGLKPNSEDVIKVAVAWGDVSNQVASQNAAKLKKANLEVTAKRKISFDSDTLNEEELKQYGISALERMLLASVTGTATVLGDPGCMIDSLVTLNKAGPFSGLQYITQVDHHLTNNSFTTSIGFGVIAPLVPPGPGGNGSGGVAAVAGKAERTASTPAGLVRGKVTSFTDPSKIGYVQVSLPWLGADQPPVWAAVAGLGAGKDRGTMVIPEPGDEVLVAFAGNDQADPIIITGLWNSKNTLPTDYDADTNNHRVVVSRSGHKVLFDDTADAERVLVVSKAKQQILIDDSAGKEHVSLSDKTGNTLVMDDKGITLTAAAGKKITLSSSNGDIVLEGMNIVAKAQVKLSGEATECALKAKAKMGVVGAMVEINGQATVKVGAPMVMIN